MADTTTLTETISDHAPVYNCNDGDNHLENETSHFDSPHFGRIDFGSEPQSVNQKWNDEFRNEKKEQTLLLLSEKNVSNAGDK